jgi:hypothetical protein
MNKSMQEKLPSGILNAILKCPLMIGIGPSAWPRIISSFYFPNFKIIAYGDCQDNDFIRDSGVEVLSLKEKDPNLEISPVTPGRILDTPIAKEFLARQKEPFALLVYKSSGILEKVCEENGWKFIGNNKEIREKFEDKRIFKETLREIGVETIPGDNIPIDDLTLERLIYYQDKLGEKKLVLQIAEATWGGGVGTLFIDSASKLPLFESRVSELRKALEGKKKKLETVNIAPFIDGISASIPCCATKYGILTGSVQTQIIDIEEVGAKLENRSGAFAGHDWAYYHPSEDIQKQASKIAQRFGDYIYKNGYKGIFGIDLIVDEKGKVWPVECNPRETDAFPLICMLQMEKGAIPMQVFHNLEHLGTPYDFDFEDVDASYKAKYNAGQIILYNKTGENLVDRKKFLAGIYNSIQEHSAIHCGDELNADMSSSFRGKPRSLERGGCHKVEKGKLNYLRSGFMISDLKNENEFLFTEDISKKPGMTYMPHERMLRLIKRGGILKPDGSLLEEVKEVVELVYKELELVPVANGVIEDFDLKTLFSNRLIDAKSNSNLQSADVVNIIRRAKEGFRRPLNIVWRKKLSTKPVLNEIPSKRARKQIKSDLKKLSELGIEIKCLPEIEQKIYEDWLALYRKIMQGKEKGAALIDEGWLNEKIKKGKKVGAILAYKKGKIIGGDIFFEVYGVLSVGYGIASKEEELSGGLTLLLDYKFMDYAQTLGYREVSLGQDSNLYGFDLSIGLLAYKTKLGFTPLPGKKTYWVTTYFRNFAKFGEKIMLFTNSEDYLSENLKLDIIEKGHLEGEDYGIYMPQGVSEREVFSSDKVSSIHNKILQEDIPTDKPLI